MYIPLPHDVEELIARKVEAGEYETPTDVLIHAVRLLDAHDRVRQQRLEDLRREIAIAIEQCERGETEPFTKQTVQRIAVERRQRLAERLCASESKPTG